MTKLKSLVNALHKYSMYKPRPLSIAQLSQLGKKNPIESIKFMKDELPIRLAHMTREIECLPKEMLETPSVKEVKNMYLNSFQDLYEFPDFTTMGNEEVYKKNFISTIQHILRRHDPVVVTMARGIIELKNSPQYAKKLEKPIQYFLDRLYMNRISIRVIIQQFIGVHTNEGQLFNEKVNVNEIIESAATHARALCEEKYRSSPLFEIHTTNGTKSPITIPYIPSHLYHMLFELLKNSMRAVVEHHGDHLPEDELPPIKIDICKAKTDLTIKIADCGGGFPNHVHSQLFNYSYSTAEPPNDSEYHHGGINFAPLAGLGYGLPIARLYARYFGGDLILVPIEGYGCESFLYLRVNPNTAHEILPTYNTAAVQKYKDHRLMFHDFMSKEMQLKYCK